MPGKRGLFVVDLGLGMATALVAKFLAESGAMVARLEPPSGDPFYYVYPAYEIWRRGAKIEKGADEQSARLHGLLANADICLIGGEDFPGVNWRHDAAALARQYPRLVVLEITGYPAISQHAGRPGSDILVQARSGLAFEHYSQRPLLMSFEPSNYGAALQGLVALYGALYERERSGKGQIASTSLYEGTLSWLAMLWCEASRPTPGFDFVMPLDPWPLVFRCADDRYLHVILGSTGSKGRLYRILGIDDPTVDINDSGLPRPRADTKNFFGDVDLLASYFIRRERAEVLEAIWEAGLAAEAVLAPGECWDDPQAQHNEIIVRDEDGTRHVGNPVRSVASPAPRLALEAGRMPLEGVTVVDFGVFAAGPYTSVILADLGANVIKVESLGGDPNRGIFRAFSSCNRGKRSIALDMKTEKGREIAQKLCLSADIVTNNFRTGVSARLGIDAKSLQRLKPELIVLESAAYGATGPKSGRAGFDMAFQAFCGHEYRAGGKGNSPLWNRTSMVDYAGGLLGAVAILRALYERAHGGGGAELNVALMNSGIFLLSELIQRADGTFHGAPELNREQSGYHPAEQMYEARDGWIAISARSDEMALSLANALGLTGLAAKPRGDWNETDAAEIAAAIRVRPVHELAALFERAGVWAEICRKDAGPATLGDAALLEAGTIRRSRHPLLGDIREIGCLFRYSRSQRSGAGHAPLLGENTRELLEGLGYTQEAIQDFLDRKVAA